MDVQASRVQLSLKLCGIWFRGVRLNELLVIRGVVFLATWDHQELLSHTRDWPHSVEADEFVQGLVSYLVVAEELVGVVSCVHQIVFTAVGRTVRDRVTPHTFTDTNKERSRRPVSEKFFCFLAGNNSWKDGTTKLRQIQCWVCWLGARKDLSPHGDMSSILNF